MINIETIKVTGLDGNETDYVIIDRGDGEFTSMPEAVWDEQQAQKELGGTL